MLKTSQVTGKTTLLRGNKETIYTLLMSAAGKLQKHSKVLFIDSANRFNPHLLRTLFTENIVELLQNILVARPFTAYQLKEVILSLKTTIKTTQAKALIISSIDKLCPEFEKAELPYLLPLLLNEINALTRQYNLITIIGSTLPNDLEHQNIHKIIKKKVDQIYMV